MPAFEIWIASASVPVRRPEASTVYSIPSRSAASQSSSKTFGESVEPRPITGPDPSGWLPDSFSSIPGVSVAWVTSIASARSGSTAKALVPAPLRPISSWTEAIAAIRPREPAALVAAAQRLERDVGAEPVVHRARDQPAAVERTGSASITTGSPIRTSSSARRGRRRRCRCAGPSSSTACFFCSSLSRWIALRPTTPGTGPSRVSTRTRWPTRICASQPPIGAKYRKPFSSTWVIASPISSMWPTTASRGRRLARRSSRSTSRSRRRRARRTTPPRARSSPPGPRSPTAPAPRAASRAVRGSRSPAYPNRREARERRSLPGCATALTPFRHTPRTPRALRRATGPRSPPRSQLTPIYGRMRPRRVDQSIAALARRQHGVVGRAQLRGLGLAAGGSAIGSRSAPAPDPSRRLRGRPHRPHGPGTVDGGRTGGGPGAVLSHRSAAVAWESSARPDAAIEVTVPRRRRWLRPHRPSSPSAGDEITLLDAIPVTTVPRTLFDLAAVVPRHLLRHAINEAEYLRLRDPLSIIDMLERYPGRRGVRALRSILAEQGPAPSAPAASSRTVSWSSSAARGAGALDRCARSSSPGA